MSESESREASLAGGDVTFHKYLDPRLNSIYKQLMAGYDGGKPLSGASKGHEREVFIRSFLSDIFPPIYRFGTGDITDIHEERSGQVDIVAEYPLMCSFPPPLNSKAPRLFLAESVAVALEVKSNLQSQWSEVLSTARKVKKLRRQFKKDALLRTAAGYRAAADLYPENRRLLLEMEKAQRFQAKDLPHGPGESIPFYAIGFGGWKKVEALEKRLISAMDGETRLVDGVLQLDIQAWRCCHGQQLSQLANQSQALLVFVDALEWHFNQEVVPQRLAWTYLVETKRARELATENPE